MSRSIAGSRRIHCDGSGLAGFRQAPEKHAGSSSLKELQVKSGEQAGQGCLSRSQSANRIEQESTALAKVKQNLVKHPQLTVY